MAKRPYRPAVHVLAANVDAVLDLATDDDYAAGAAWYADARAAAADLATTYGVSIDVAAGVLAALSPRVDWTHNLAWARATLAAGRAPAMGLGGSRRAADRIVGAAPYAPTAPADVLRGPKVSAFHANIVGDESRVTVDRHAYDIARGRRGAYDKRGGELARPTVHAAFREAYARVAAARGMTPAAVQAVAWVTWRRVHDTAAHRRDAARTAA